MNLSTTSSENKNTVAENEVEKENLVISPHQEQDENEDLSSLTLTEKIIYWKNKYKRVFKTIIDGEDYIWRRINRREYSDIAFQKISEISKLDIYEKQYLFCKTAVLYPDNIEEVMYESAGIAQTLADEIIFKSGFGDIYPKTVELGEDGGE